MKNRKFWISLISGFMAVIMLLGLVLSILPVGVSARSTEEIQGEIDDLESEQRGLWNRMDDLESRQNDNWETTEDMVEQKNNIDHQINVLNSEICNLDAQIRNYSLLIAENQVKLDEAEQVLAEMNAKNKERIQAMEEEGKVSFWSVVFKANSFTDLIDRLALIQEIQEADRRRLTELSDAAEVVSQTRSDLQHEKTELDQSRLRMDEAQAELEEKRAQADKVLAELIEKDRELQEMYDKYESMARSIDAQIAAAEKAYTEAQKQENPPADQGSGQAPSSGGWVRPCTWTVLTCPYGWRIHPITGKKSFHSGVDLANVEGTPIYAAKSGTVTGADYNSVYGYHVTINHGGGFSSLYGHMTNYVVSQGQSVSAGQLIGYMGSTGWSTGPHLHFTIYYNGNTVNPMDYI